MSISETASAPNALPASTQASAYEAEVKAEQTRLIYTQANFGVIASALIALITAATIHSSVPPTPLLIWLLVMAVVLVFRALLIRRYFSASKDERASPSWEIRYTLQIGLTGATWGSAFMFAHVSDAELDKFFITFVLAGMLAGGLLTMLPSRKVFAAYGLPLAVPMDLWLMLANSSLHVVMGILAATYTALLFAITHRYHMILISSIRLAIENTRLLERETRSHEHLQQVNLALRDEIHERQSVETALRRMADQQRLILDSVDEGIYGVDPDNQPTFMNAAASRLTGWHMESVAGKNLDELLNYEKSRPTSATFNEKRERNLRNRSGNTVPVEYSSKPLLEEGKNVGAVVVIKDVTEKRKIEAAQRESESSIRELYRIVTRPVQSTHDRLVDLIKLGCKRFGMEIGALTRFEKTKCHFVIAIDPQEQFNETLELNTEQTLCALTALASTPLGVDGNSPASHLDHPFFSQCEATSYLGSPVMVQGEVYGTLFFAGRRNSDRVFSSAEREVIQLMAQLTGSVTEQELWRREVEQHRDRLNKLSRLNTMGEITAGLAHELNQPLTAVIGFADAASTRLTGDAPDLKILRELVESIADQSVRASQIIRKLRNFVSQDLSQRKPTKLSELIADLDKVIEAEVAAKGVVVEKIIPANTGELIVDRLQIQQVILNLIYNASEAMQNQPGIRRIILSACNIGNALLFSVVDNGQGLTREQAEQATFPFYTTKSGGLGLGLTICQSIVESHGGKLWLSTPKAGLTEACFTLPGTKEMDNE